MRALKGLKDAVRENKVLFHVVRTVRFAAIAGPLRPLMIRYHQVVRRNPPLATTERSIFDDLDPAAVARQIEQDGYAPGLKLPESYVERLVECDPEPGGGALHGPHLTCPVVAEVAHDPSLVEVARRYLGAEPVMATTLMWWTVPEYGPQHANRYHFDVADYKSLTLFFYLTDVDMECGPHCVIKGTHRNKKLRDFASIYMSDEEAGRRYGPRIEVITGPRGTGFFEEQTIYHKAKLASRRRLILCVIYTLSRRPTDPTPYAIPGREAVAAVAS